MEVQLFCSEAGFPSGLVKELFYAIYVNDIISEETFTAWKEDTTETVGKRQTMLHATAFFRWLDEALAEEAEEFDYELEPPDGTLCPITNEVMPDPVYTDPYTER